MTTKTPEEVAYRQVESIIEHVPLDEDAQSFWINQIREAIEADRAQRTEIHEDWRDDQENVRDAAYVDMAFYAYLHSDDDEPAFFSDMRLTAAQAVGMFQGIGEASL